MLAIGCADGRFICDAMVLGTLIWFCCAGDCGLGLCIDPSDLMWPMRGDVPASDGSGMLYAGYPEAADIAACEADATCVA